MIATDNQKALLKEIGLKWKDLGYGEGKIVKDSVGEEVPNGTELSDVYYPTLFQHVVSQQVNDGIRGFALEGVFLKEDWINGIKEYLSNGISDLYDYDKVITIDDWNPTDPPQNVIKYSIDFLKYSSEKISKVQILQAFTNPSTLEIFVNQIIKRMTDTWRYFLQNEKAKILAGDDSAVLQIVWDEIIDTTGMSTLDVVELATHYMESFKTASPDWLALINNKFIYSATPIDIKLIMRPFFKASLARESSSLFNYNQLITDKFRNAPTIDLLKAGIAESGIRLWLMDNGAIREGYQIEDVNWDFRAPKLQRVMEIHNWVGFAAIPTLYKSIWMDVPAPEIAKMKKIKGYGKVFKTKLTKGMELLKEIRGTK